MIEKSPKRGIFVKIKQLPKVMSKVANDNHPPHKSFWGWAFIILMAIILFFLIIY